jgi:two-component system, chemotaxis family, chemotaxis protein CheY
VGYRFLVVDDDQLVNRVAKEVLKLNYECEVDMTDKSDEAIRLFKSHKEGYDLVVCDLNMPDIDGLDLCRAFREMQENVPIIILTAYASDAAYEEACRIGINEFIPKPFKPAGFIDLVKKVLGTHEKKAGRLKGFEAQFWEQVEMILAGKIPAGYSSLDFIIRVLRKNRYEEPKVAKMERMVPLLKTEIAFLEARDNYMYLKTLQDQRVDRIRMIQKDILKLAASTPETAQA